MANGTRNDCIIDQDCDLQYVFTKNNIPYTPQSFTKVEIYEDYDDALNSTNILETITTITELDTGRFGYTASAQSIAKTYFDKVRTVKVIVLPAARESKEDIKKYSKELLEKMGVYYTAKIIGFTITLKKWRKARE